MALHIEDPELVRRIEELSAARRVSPEDVVRSAVERVRTSTRTETIEAWFETRMRPIVPPDQLGRTLTKAEEETLLGMED